VIFLTLRVAAGGLRIEIRDQGRGIPPERLEEVKKRGVRFDYEVGAETPPGAGFGLAVANEIVVAHRGELTLASDGKSYTEARITLPLGSREPERSDG
jgi:signal transduction histidine kinase